MTSEQARDDSLTVATFDAERLRAALAVAVFASTDKHPATEVLTCVRFTVDETGRAWAQATDRYIAAVHRHVTSPPRQPFDVAIPRDRALKLAKALRTANGEVTFDVHPHGGPAWLLTWADRKGVRVDADVSWLPLGGALFWPKILTLIAEDTPAHTGVVVDPARLVAVAEWQKLAAGEYAPPNGIALIPVGKTRGTQVRAVITSWRDDSEGLAALLCGINLAKYSQDGQDIADAVDEATAVLTDGAPR